MDGKNRVRDHDLHFISLVRRRALRRSELLLPHREALCTDGCGPSVELDARFLLRTVAIKVVPMHEVARPPQPPFSSYWPQRKCLKGANSAKWDALGSPQVVPADRDPVVVTDDSSVVIKGLLALIVESSSIRPPLRGLQVPNRT